MLRAYRETQRPTEFNSTKINLAYIVKWFSTRVSRSGNGEWTVFPTTGAGKTGNPFTTFLALGVASWLNSGSWNMDKNDVCPGPSNLPWNPPHSLSLPLNLSARGREFSASVQVSESQGKAESRDESGLSPQVTVWNQLPLRQWEWERSFKVFNYWDFSVVCYSRLA